MTAEEATQLTAKSRPEIEQREYERISEQIKTACLNGLDSIYGVTISDGLRIRLLSEGYNIYPQYLFGFNSNPFAGAQNISWGQKYYMIQELPKPTFWERIKQLFN